MGRLGLSLLVAAVLAALLHAIFGGDLDVLHVMQWLGAWLSAIPGPTEHWATILSSWSWPIAALLIVYMLRRPLRRAAHALADRIGTDDLDLWGLGVRKGDRAIPLDRAAAQAESSSFTPDDVDVIERLYEFAGDSAQNAGLLMDWISHHVDPKLDPVDFMSEPVFAGERRSAYVELVGVTQNG
jgi:hypothetical protein